MDKPEMKFMEIPEGKRILDVCCGSRMFWFDKKHKAALYGDIREESWELCDGRNLEIKPDIIMDFRQIPFKDGSFDLLVFDPPHLHRLGKSSWMAKKYGVLNYHWRDDIRDGFNECMRVLKSNGVLIFKWNEAQISVKQILESIDYIPLFGHRTSKHGKTIWLTFMKGV